MQGSNIWRSIEHDGEEIWSFDSNSCGAAKSRCHTLSRSFPQPTSDVKSMTKEYDTLHDVLSVVREIYILVKFSPKREHLLENISDNIEQEDSETFKKLKKLSTTRWTVRAECMKRIIDNYELFLQLWEDCLEEKLDQETKARIVRCKSQMESFFFLFRHQSVIQALCNDG